MNKHLKTEKEKRIIELMIKLYCTHKHKGNKNMLCETCKETLVYAHKRLSLCPFKQEKKTCRLCPTHCYKPEMRQRIKEIMRYAGPKMLFYHPLITLAHLWDECK